MTTILTPEISKKKPYYISKHRYYELKHFCLQYPEWEREAKLYSLHSTSVISISGSQVEFNDPTGEAASNLSYINKCIDAVNACCDAADPVLSNYIFSAVCYGLSYEALVSKGLPCSRGTFYDRYRKFFWFLDKMRR